MQGQQLAFAVGLALFLEANSSADLKQYYYVDEYTYNDRKMGFTAGLRAETETVFEDGAVVIPGDYCLQSDKSGSCQWRYRKR